MSNVLAIVAHADDESIGLGGTLARHAYDGDDVHVLILADGESSRMPGQDRERITARQEQARKACGILGVKDVHFESLPDNSMDTVSRLEIARVCESYISKLNPDTIYTHHKGDVNIDHVMAADGVTIATRAQPNLRSRLILFFEVASSTEWQMPADKAPFTPNWFVDIDAFWDKKQQALAVYKDEMRDFPHSRSIEAIDALSHWRGACAGVRRAEAFVLGRMIR